MTGFIPQVNFWDAFRGGREEKRRVLSQMVRLRGVSPPVLLAYCRCSSILHIPQPNVFVDGEQDLWAGWSRSHAHSAALSPDRVGDQLQGGVCSHLGLNPTTPLHPISTDYLSHHKGAEFCVILLTWKAGLPCRCVPMTMRGSSLYYKKCSSEQSVSHSTRR